MKLVKLIGVIGALVALGCSDDYKQNEDGSYSLGKDEEALSMHDALMGWPEFPRNGGTWIDQCRDTDPVGDRCFAARSKSLNAQGVFLNHGCASSFWQTGLSAAVGDFNRENASGSGNPFTPTGFNYGGVVSNVVTVSVSCDATYHAPNGAKVFMNIPPTSLTCSGKFCEYGAVTVLLAGNDIVNTCNANPTKHCDKYLENLLLRGLYAATGASWHQGGISLMATQEPGIVDFGMNSTWDALGGDFQRMQQYTP